MTSIYQFKITLQEISPKIWRRIQVPSEFTFGEFNAAILAAMGWSGEHLHQFEIRNPMAGNIDVIAAKRLLTLDDPDADQIVLDHIVKLSQYFSAANSKATHEYDFANSWCHTILFEAELPIEAGVIYPRCIDGENACPPEDCGGIFGYTDFLDARQRSKSDASREILSDFAENFGANFDPEAFDVKKANERLGGKLGKLMRLGQLKKLVMV